MKGVVPLTQHIDVSVENLSPFDVIDVKILCMQQLETISLLKWVSRTVDQAINHTPKI